MADSSTSLKVAWNGLNNGDENGIITQYRVCYKQVFSPGDICNSPARKTKGNVLRITLYNLEKYTDYVVAVQAATKIGFGPVGVNMTRRTMEESKYNNTACSVSCSVDRCGMVGHNS